MQIDLSDVKVGDKVYVYKDGYKKVAKKTNKELFLENGKYVVSKNGVFEFDNIPTVFHNLRECIRYNGRRKICK